jgi:hypothetical protein
MKTIKIILIAVLFISAYSASAQWTDGGSYQTTTDLITVGAATAPTGTLDVINPSNTSKLIVGSPYSGTGTPIRNIGVINLTNTDPTSGGDIYYLGIRKSSLGTEAIQSVYEKSTNKWKEFSYINIQTGKYEIRPGVGLTEFKNNGNILFNNIGSIGIGTGSTIIPSTAKLAVNGKILATEVQVALVANWSDYVFNDDYNLKPLNEVERFINENKHLPDVPSAKEVAIGGINVAKMDAILLQKIEELTLYVIELKKENEILKSKIK